MNQQTLTDRLDAASKLYYQGLPSEFTDTEFDLKLKELQQMEKESGIVYPNSPTQRVGSDARSDFGKVKHTKPMLTIENTYNDKELQEWITKMCSEISDPVFDISIKYDGVSLDIQYKDGLIESASTRGDKIIGDDVTANAKTIKDIPLSVNVPSSFHVRGEVLMPKSYLAILNEERIANGEEPFRNTRNACTGSLKQLDSSVTAKRGLIFRGWDCYSDDGIDFAWQTHKFKVLKNLGFTYEEGTDFISVKESQEGDVVKAVNEFKAKIDALNLDYDYDGVVIKVGSVAEQNRIGTKDTRAIEWGIARKWNEEYMVETELKGVEWQVGRTGVLTPVGKLEPVECGGVTISNVSLINEKFILDMGILSNSTLKITRSGGVIPYVVGVGEPHYLASNLVYVPKVCPVCGKPLVKEGALLKCVNEECPAIAKGKILQFCSKDCADIKSIGEEVVSDLYEKGLIRSIEDILFQGFRACIGSCKEEDIKRWVDVLGEGYGEKSIRNIMDSLEYSRLYTPYEKLIAGLSIPGVGKSMARVLAKKYNNIFALERATIEELITLDGIAETSATAIYNWIQKNTSLLDDIDHQGWNWMAEASDAVEDAPLDGLNVVFSGSSSRFSGDQVEEFLESKGAKCGHSVSKKTSYLIVGEKPGPSKVKKAEECGVEVITEGEFYEKFGL